MEWFKVAVIVGTAHDAASNALNKNMGASFQVAEPYRKNITCTLLP
jgi:hypothetical protein